MELRWIVIAGLRPMVAERTEFEIPRTCVLTLQGGGALGVELIGQLQGIVGDRTVGGQPTGNHGMQTVGIAGTSAGAIIATLHWARYPPAQILSHVQATFSRSGREGFFGPFRWGRLASFPALERYIARIRAGFSSASQRPGASWLLLPLAQWLARLIAFVRLCRLLIWTFRNRGIVGGDGFVNRIDELLKQSPRFHDAFGDQPGRLTFGDVRTRDFGQVPLFLMITDVAGGRLVIVSSIDDRWLDLPIAEAVRASAGFPYFFRPVPIGDAECCIDGGVISNVPTWVFDRAFRDSLRRVKPKFPGEDAILRGLSRQPWHHVALRLGEDAAGPAPTGPFAYLSALLTLLTGLGRRRLEDEMFRLVASKRFIVAASADTPRPARPASVLDFEALADPTILNALYRLGRETAQGAINPARFAIPPEAAALPILQDLAAQAAAALQPYLKPGSVVRTNVFLPISKDELQIAYRCNMAGDSDERIEIAKGQAVTSVCYLYGEPVLANLRDELLNLVPADWMQPFRPATREDRTWLLSTPVIDVLDARPRQRAPEDAGALVLDTEGPLFGVLNIDAAVLYFADGIDRDPVLQSRHPAVRLVFDAAKSASAALGMLINQAWIEERDVRHGRQLHQPEPAAAT